METSADFSLRPLLAVLVSIFGALLIVGTGERRANLREFWSVAAGVLKLLLVASMIPDVQAGRTPQCVLFQILPGMELAFRVDSFGLLFALGASVLWIATSFYSIGYMRSLQEHAQTRYFACFAIALSATIGVAFSANLFTLFLFYEALTFSTYPLVGHKTTAEAKAGARKYVIYLLGSAKLFLVAAIILTYNVAGTLEFRKGGILPASEIICPAGTTRHPFCPIPVWFRQERRHAAAQLASGSDGCAYAGQRAPACGSRREDRGLRHAPGLPVHLWI